MRDDFLWLFNPYAQLNFFFYTLGAIHNIVDIDYKKRSEAESASFNFRIKKISAYGVDDDILEEIKKFPFPFQQLIVKEACAVMNRLEKGKGVPGLSSLDCLCLFRHRYLLPCKHIFHEHMYGNKLLTADVWQMFRGHGDEQSRRINWQRWSLNDQRSASVPRATYFRPSIL